jgi:N6-adenosine-specific RNA methylase IME4
MRRDCVEKEPGMQKLPDPPMRDRVVLFDCPWPANDRREFRRDNPTKKLKFGFGAKSFYERAYGMGDMTIQSLVDLGPGIRGICDPDAYLFQWATWPMIKEAIFVMEGWGFDYVTCFATWVKIYPSAGTHFQGPGRYSFSNTENLLIGKLGKLWHPNTGYRPQQPTIVAEEEDFEGFEGIYQEIETHFPGNEVFRVPHPRNSAKKIIHSRKPEGFQDSIDRWLDPYIGTAGKMEGFATRVRPGWACLGCGIDGSDIREALRMRRLQQNLEFCQFSLARTLAKAGIEL